MKVYTDKDADLSVLKGKTCAVLGFGSQGHAHALNLKESGVKVIIGRTAGRPSMATTRSAMAPTARMPACGWTMMAVNAST